MHVRGERRVVGEGVGGQRLLEALEIELVEAGERRCMGECVAAVCIRGERESITDGAPCRVQHRGIAARFDLALHAPVPDLDVVPQELAEARVVAEPDRDACVDLRAYRAEMRGERDAVAAQAAVEQRAFERGTRRVVAADGRKWRAREERREEVVAQDEPRRVDRVGGVGRSGERRALTPALAGLAAYAHEQRFFGRGLAGRRAKGLDEWHADAEELGFVEDACERTRERARACGPGSHA